MLKQHILLLRYFGLLLLSGCCVSHLQMDSKCIQPVMNDSAKDLKAAHSEDKAAQCRVGVSLFEHQSQEAFVWFTRSAEQGYGPGQVWLGKAYLQGRGVHVNPEKGFYWIKKAAIGGHTEACYLLGSCYLVDPELFTNH